MEVQQPERRSRQNSLVEIEISCSSDDADDDEIDSPLVATTSSAPESKTGSRRGSILRIIESDDESWACPTQLRAT